MGVVGIALGTAILPLLSRQLATGNRAGALASQNRGIEIGLLFALPAAAALLVMPGLILSVLFERGAFGPAETAATSAALSAYAPGIPAFILVKVLSAAYFAREDTAGPVRIAVICMGVNILLSLALSQVLAHAGIALATALAAWLNVGSAVARPASARGLGRRCPAARAPAALGGGGRGHGDGFACFALELAGPLATGPLRRFPVGGLWWSAVAALYGGAAVLLRGASLAELRGITRRRKPA